MQPLSWYAERLRAMSADEVGWRIRSSLRDVTDRPRFALAGHPSAPSGTVETQEPGFRVSDLQVAEWSQAPAGTVEQEWRDRLLQRADRIAEHRLSFFNIHDRHLGDPIDWNRDHESGRGAPMTFAPSIDYRDHAVTGDCKVVWEPNRHHHLVVLGRAYRASGDLRYASAVVEQLSSWLNQNPFGRGMNWRSPLELSIRLINWVWAIDLVRESGLVEGELGRRLWHSIFLHHWDITRKYSCGSSANNHRVGEAAGVFVGSSYFRQMPGADRWRDESYGILCDEILAQTYPDGCTREQAFGYHLFVLQFYLIAGIAGRRTGREFPAAYWNRLERMLEFAGAYCEGADHPSYFGDCDDGYVLDLGDGGADVEDLLCTGAVVFDAARLKAQTGTYRESTMWLLGRESRSAYDRIAVPSTQKLVSRAFPDSGYYLLQAGDRRRADALSVVFDCGELGFGAIAAHGHADALSFTLRAFGREVLVDPGTYDYFTFPAWRAYFRSTPAHNTVVIDGQDQSTMAGLFLWKQRAAARCTAWEPNGSPVRVAGEHDGYQRLADPVRHRRTIALGPEAGLVTVQDDLSARAGHDVTIYFHVSETCATRARSEHEYEIETGLGQVLVKLDPRLSVTMLRGSDDPVAGWVSRRYHQRAPAVTLVGRARWSGDVSYLHEFRQVQK